VQDKSVIVNRLSGEIIDNGSVDNANNNNSNDRSLLIKRII